jgi:hypothetical protein
MYDYHTPPGYGDTFFQYVFDAQAASPALTNGSTIIGQLGIPVLDGSFVARQWSGLNTIASKLQIYDWLRRQFFSQMVQMGVNSPALFYGNKPVLPEVEWPDSGKILFDLGNVQQTSQGTDGGTNILASQLVFSGVRRRANVISDPAPSTYKYYEKDYSIPFTLAVDNYATTNGVFNPPVQQIIPVQDFDFELRRVELGLQSAQQTSQFKILMYNSDWRQLANSAVLSNLFCHTNPELNSGELSFWPSPPVLYRVNSVIRFDIFSLLVSPTVLPQTFQMTFRGVRRIPC